MERMREPCGDRVLFCVCRGRGRKEEQKMYIIAGLGNPSAKYEKTRHNIGFDVIDALAGECGIELRDRQCKALCGSGILAGQKALLVKPQTYMNLSGEAIGALLSYYKIDPETNLLVIYDDVSLNPGAIRIRLRGSAGGHNGIKNIISHLGTQSFARIKVGVGEKPKDWDLADYVLGRFSKEERAAVDDAIKDAIAAVDLILQDRASEAMNRFNSKKKSKEME